MPKDSSYKIIVDSTIQGIPCKLGVIEIGYYEEAYRSGHPDNWEPESYSPHDYEVLDRKGYKANWLASKMDSKDWDCHQKDIDKYLSELTND